MEQKLIIRKHFGDNTQDYADVLNRGFYQTDWGQVDIKDVFFMEQIHSALVVIIDDVVSQKRLIPKCDALLTTQKGIFLAVRTADCFPLLVYDKKKEIISAIHSGRDGTKLKIIEEVLNIMKKSYLCNPKDIMVEIGAGICQNHHEVSEEIATEYNTTYNSSSLPILNQTEFSTSGRWYIDMRRHIIETAIKNGIEQNNISFDPVCTFESDKYFSYRRDNDQKRQISMIGMVYV